MKFDRDQIEEDLQLIEGRISRDEILRATLGTVKSTEEKMLDDVFEVPSGIARDDSQPLEEDIRYLARTIGIAHRLVRSSISNGTIRANQYDPEEDFYSHRKGAFVSLIDLSKKAIPGSDDLKFEISQELGTRTIDFDSYFFGGYKLNIELPHPLNPSLVLTYSSARKRLPNFTVPETRLATFVTEGFIELIQRTRN